MGIPDNETNYLFFENRQALVRAGGGARAAYQVGVLRAIADWLPPGRASPFEVLVGTSAGAINAAALAARASSLAEGVAVLEAVWSGFRSAQVVRCDPLTVLRGALHWTVSLMSSGWLAAPPRSLLDTTPLRELLQQVIPLEKIRDGLEQGPLEAVAVATTSYTLLCGHLFRISTRDGWYVVAVRDRIFHVRQSVNQLEFHGIDRESLIHYFALDEPYSAILKEIDRDRHIGKAIRRYHGLRIVRQDPWECLISFLCSSAANIPKIKLNLEILSQSFGKKIDVKGVEMHTFPAPGDLNDYEQTVRAKTGFRAKYLKTANDLVSEAFLLSLKKLPYEEAKRALKDIPGIAMVSQA